MTKSKNPRKYIKRYYLIERRIELGLTQGQLAELIYMDRPTYNRVEYGVTGFLMNATRLKLLADALRMSIAEIVHLESDFYSNFCSLNHLNLYWKQ